MSSFNLLIEPVFTAAPGGGYTLPGLLAALMRGEAASLPALRPHQAPAFHCFAAQLGALAHCAANRREIAETEAEWCALLRELTPGFPDDEPWCLAVPDHTKPAFLQAPVPKGVRLPNPVETADGLDLLITSRNHDVKQAIAREGQAQDWAFALISLQTGEGYGGAGNHGIARMNGGSSSRPFLGLAPMPAGEGESPGRHLIPDPGAHLRRDIEVLLSTREEHLSAHDHLGYPRAGGLGLVWLADWPEGQQLHLNRLDIWFIEICRRVRLQADGQNRLSAMKGTSKAPRITAKELKGNLGDPWAPVHKADAKSFTLGGGDFHYRTLSRLLFGEKGVGDWELPLLARRHARDPANASMLLVAQALSRGNSKTEGFKSRVLPISRAVSVALGFGAQKKLLHDLAKDQTERIAAADKALSFALALVSASGDSDRLSKEDYVPAGHARARFDRQADGFFFPHLWQRFALQDAQEAFAEEKASFEADLREAALAAFEEALPSIPCASLFRLQAETRGRRLFWTELMKALPSQRRQIQTRKEEDERKDILA